MSLIKYTTQHELPPAYCLAENEKILIYLSIYLFVCLSVDLSVAVILINLSYQLNVVFVSMEG